MNKRICVIGGGRWGKNHIRTLNGMGCLSAVVESNADRLNDYKSQYPDIVGYIDVDEAIAAKYDGYTIATPAETHYEIALKIISAGLNVMIEKPMTLLPERSLHLAELAEKTGSRVMVGHVLLFHPAIKKIKYLVDSGKIGKLYYMYSNRLNLGTIRTEESVFSSFAPHDVSVLDYIAGHHSIGINAHGAKYLQKKVYDTTITLLDYPDNVNGHIFVSWLHPFKQQLLVVVGSEGMISFDDASQEKEIKFYHKKIDFENGIPVKVEEPDEIIPYDRKQPLEEELRYFVEHLDVEIEVNTARHGYEVVKVLHDVQELLNSRENGRE